MLHFNTPPKTASRSLIYMTRKMIRIVKPTLDAVLLACIYKHTQPYTYTYTSMYIPIHTHIHRYIHMHIYALVDTHTGSYTAVHIHNIHSIGPDTYMHTHRHMYVMIMIPLWQPNCPPNAPFQHPKTASRSLMYLSLIHI